MLGITLVLAAGLYGSNLKRTDPATHEHYIGRVMGTLFLALYALYYYWLYVTI